MDNTLALRLRKLRKEKGFSMDELAKRTGVSKAYISQIESGESSNPSGEVLYNLSTILDVSIAYLLGRSTQTSPSSDSSPTPKELEKAVIQYKIPKEYIPILAGIEQRTDNRSAKSRLTKDDWHYLYETIRRVKNQD